MPSPHTLSTSCALPVMTGRWPKWPRCLGCCPFFPQRLLPSNLPTPTLTSLGDPAGLCSIQAASGQPLGSSFLLTVPERGSQPRDKPILTGVQQQGVILWITSPGSNPAHITSLLQNLGRVRKFSKPVSSAMGQTATVGG